MLRLPMQKISSYLYSNRIQLMADVIVLDAAYPVEWKIVYQRPIKIYKGVDNVIELDVKNADQKRIDIYGKTIKFVVMDQTDKEVNTYTATVLDDGSTVGVKGLAKVTISAADTTALQAQYLKFSVYMLNNDSTKTVLYGDTRFGAHGTLELLGGVLPVTRPIQRYSDFQQETNYQGLAISDRIVTHYSGAIPVKYYEATPTTTVDVSVSVTGFTGSISIQATKNIVTGHEAFLHPIIIQTQTFTVARDTPVLFTDINIADYTYIRVGYINTTGTVDFFTVAS